ncbi:hypothetical protein ACVT98_22860 [Vibrio campbellii]
METTEQVDECNQSKSKVLPRSALILGTLFFAAVVARFYVAFRYEVNWDEFYYLSFVHQLINGEAINSFQTFHIHFFTWLQYVSSNEVDQIIAARLVMIFFQLGTGLCIYKLCRLQCSVSGALFAVLAYFAFSFNVRMGASFRTDPDCDLPDHDLFVLCLSESTHLAPFDCLWSTYRRRSAHHT